MCAARCSFSVATVFVTMVRQVAPGRRNRNGCADCQRRRSRHLRGHRRLYRFPAWRPGGRCAGGACRGRQGTSSASIRQSAGWDPAILTQTSAPAQQDCWPIPPSAPDLGGWDGLACHAKARYAIRNFPNLHRWLVHCPSCRSWLMLRRLHRDWSARGRPDRNVLALARRSA